MYCPSRQKSNLAVFTLSFFCSLIFTNSAWSLDGLDCSIASEAIEAASRLRGLKIVRKVPCKLQNRKEVERYLLDTIKKKITEEKVKNEGRLYRLLGFIPEDYDYLNGVVKLYTDQLGGYYDPDREYYAMASWMPLAMQMPIAVHELTHALQDQHYQLDKMTSPDGQVSDALLARAALIEGDATSIMLDYSRGLMGQTPLAEEESVSMFMLQNISGAMFSQSLHKAPPALQASLIFPYVSGLRFAHALLKKGGYPRIDKAFKELPSSTEEILHPEKYFSGKKDFVEIENPKAPTNVRLKSEKVVFSDRLGEFLISTLLGTWLPPQEASLAASGWGGDKVSMFELEGSSRGFVVWNTAWDSEDESKEFYQALVKAYSLRFKKTPVRTSKKASFVDKDFGPVRIERDGVYVKVVVGG